MIVEDQYGPMSDEEDDKIETEAEVSALLDSMEPTFDGSSANRTQVRELEAIHRFFQIWIENCTPT